MKGKLESFRKKVQDLVYLNYRGHAAYPEMDIGLSEDELLYELAKINVSNLFLGHYSEEALWKIFTTCSITEHLQSLWFHELLMRIDAQDILEHRLCVYYDKKEPDHLLLELRVREGYFDQKKEIVPGFKLDSIDLLMVDWLCLQNPLKDFSPERPRLPGQRHPGLGIVRKIVDLILRFANDFNKEGILNTPAYYHVAALYAQLFFFFDPTAQGRFLALMRDMDREDLLKVIYAIPDDCLIDARTGNKEKWAPGEQILPLSTRLKKYFGSTEYKAMVEEAYHSHAYKIDWDLFERLKPAQFDV